MFCLGALIPWTHFPKSFFTFHGLLRLTDFKISMVPTFFSRALKCVQFMDTNSGAFPSRLPEFSLHNIPKRVKIYQIATKLPNGRNIFQVTIENTNVFNSNALQNLPKLGFWFENIPSGNPPSH
jgi:hypothetical protein